MQLRALVGQQQCGRFAGGPVGAQPVLVQSSRMTLIAGFRANGFPVVLGDVLVSGPAEFGLERLPVVDDLRTPFTERTQRPVALRQKVAIVGENVAVAWAGPAIAAQSVLRELIARSQDHFVTHEEVKCVLAELEDCQVNRELQLIGMVADGTSVRGFAHNIREDLQARNGSILVGGSGAADLVGDFDMSPLPAPPHNLSHFDHAVGCALTIAGRLLALELHGGWNLRNLYGGAYEAAFFWEGRFQKMTDVTYLFWLARPTEAGFDMTMPLRLIRQSYVDDVLIYRCASLEWRDDHFTFSQDHSYAITPVYCKESTPDPGSSDALLTTDFLCNLVICTDSEGINRAVLSRVDARRGADQPLSFAYDSNGQSRAVVNSKRVREMMEGARPSLTGNGLADIDEVISRFGCHHALR